MDTLEKKCESVEEEGRKWKSKCEELEKMNNSLVKQLAKLQAQVSAMYEDPIYNSNSGLIN